MRPVLCNTISQHIHKSRSLSDSQPEQSLADVSVRFIMSNVLVGMSMSKSNHDACNSAPCQALERNALQLDALEATGTPLSNEPAPVAREAGLH